MRITGLVFAGTSTDARARMRGFARAVLGLRPGYVEGIDADVFDLPEGSQFAIAAAGGMGTDRTIGFLVDDLDEAAKELRAAGIPTDASISVNERWRYL